MSAFEVSIIQDKGDRAANAAGTPRTWRFAFRLQF